MGILRWIGIVVNANAATAAFTHLIGRTSLAALFWNVSVGLVVLSLGSLLLFHP